MTPQTVTYTRRMPMEQYGYAEMTSTATVGDEETPLEAFMALKAEVEKAVATDVAAASQVEEAPKTRGKKAAKAEVVEEVTVEDTPPDEEEEEEVTPKAAKKFKSKATVYSRNNETHKALFAEAMSAMFPTWKKTDDGKAKAKKLSVALDGKDYLDADGEILPSFTALMKKGFK